MSSTNSNNHNVYSFEIKVMPNMIDNLNHVNNMVYLQWANLAATKHWNILSNNNFDEQYVWVVLRHEIDYLKPAFLNDKIIIKTWVGETQGVKSTRYVEIYGNTKLVAKIKTVWVMLDAKTMRPKRISADVLATLKPNK